MQKYKEINGNDYVKNSRTTINETMQSIQSMNSGTAFPTNNLFEGMKCYRTDLKKTYTLTDVENNTWVEDAHAALSDEATHAASATKLDTARSLNLGGAVTADAATFDGTANATINVKTLDATKLKGTASVSTTGNASTATKVVATAAAGASANIAEATMASSDYARIRVSGNDNAGELALETADDGSEPIVARQYTGAYTNAVRTAKILDESGNTSFPGTVVAPKFTGALNGNAATATKLQTARTLSLTGKAAGSATFDGSANASINVTSVDADTASKLSTARKINITGNATGSAGFDGTSDVNINVTVNSATKATNDGNGANIASTYVKKEGDTTTGKITFESTDLNALPEVKKTSDDDMSGIRFSSKTKFLGAVGKCLSNGEDLLNLRSDNTTTDVVLDSRNYNNYAPTKTGGGASGTWNINISGTATNATKATTAATCSGNSTTATTLNNRGNRDPAANGTKVVSGLNLYQVYNNGYPTTYGNVLSIGGTGGGEILAGWSGKDAGMERLYYRNQRDTGTLAWSAWKTVAYTDDISNYAPSKTGSGASGTWGINVSGSATNADKLDGYHENSFLRYRGAAAATGEDTYWNQIGIKEYDHMLPKGVSGTYNFGAVVSLPGSSTRLDIWYNHLCSENGDGLWYRSGWSTDQKAWARLLDSNNFNNWAPTKKGTGASGTWPISVSGNAASATNADKLDGYHASDIINRISAANTGGIVAASLTENGYAKFANGLILQWGNAANPVTFPIAFPTTALNVVTTLQTSGDSGNMSKNRLYVQTLTTTGFSIQNPQGTYRYYAVG